MKKNNYFFYLSKIFLGLTFLLAVNVLSAQNQTRIDYRGDMNSWADNNINLTSLTLPSGDYSWVTTILSDGDDNPSEYKFDDDTDWSNSWGAGNTALTLNTEYTLYANGGNGGFAETNGKYYTFTFLDVTDGSNTSGYIYGFTETPASISAITEASFSVDAGEDITITATCASKATEQKIWLRYSDQSNFSSSTLVEMTLSSGNNYTADIPGSYNTSEKTVYYYALSTGNTTPTNTDADAATINFLKPVDNTYTVASVPALLTGQFSNNSGTNGVKDYSTGWYFENQFAGNYTLITTADGAGDNSFRFKNTSGTQRQPTTDGNEISVNQNTPYTSNIEDGSANAFKITNANTSYRYVFRVNAAISEIAIFEIQGTTISAITAVSDDNPGTIYYGDDLTVTATLDNSFNTGQAAWLRYTTDSWTNSTCVKMTGSGTSYSADIPIQTGGTNVEYYVFTSGDVSSIAHANADLYSINWDNNSGSNYSYSVSAIGSPTAQTASVYNQTQIDLNWTQDATHNTVIVLARKGSAPDDLSQATAYSQGTGDIETAAGFVLYKGTDDYSVTDYNHTGLDAGSAYHYKFFSVNNDYYSTAVAANTSTTGYETVQDGDWNTAATWLNDNIPATDADAEIKHAVTVNAAVVNNPGTVTINSGSSLTFGASGDLTVNSSATIDGTADMTSGGLWSIASSGTFTNNSTFTSGAGTVEFEGDGTASGTLSFNNIDIAGDVNLGANATVTGTLQINTGGDLITNSLTYTAGSVLRFNRDYTAADNKLWYRSTAATGSPQVGIPHNVEIAAGNTLTIGNDGFYRALNGDITINGTLVLGSVSGGDLELLGDFINNGSFTHSSRAVEFNGSSAQTIDGTNFPDFAYVIIDNTAGLSLSRSISVANNLNFINGSLSLNNSNLWMGGSATFSNNTASKYVVSDGTGYLYITVGTTEITFPIGTGTIYAPAFLKQDGTSEYLGTRVKNSIDNSTLDDTYAVTLQWTVNENSATGNNITTKFQWNTSDEGTNFDRTGTVEIGRYIGGFYASESSTVSGTNPYDATATAGVSSNVNPLNFVVANATAFNYQPYTTATAGDWNATATWTGGAVPHNGADVTINHAVTVNQDIFVNTLDNNSTLTSGTGQARTITFGDAGTFTNDGTFIANDGSVVFATSGTVNGTSTLTFFNLQTSGALSLISGETVNGTFTINVGGSLSGNSISYGNSSVLKYNTGEIFNRAIEWNYGITTGAGHPNHVTVANGTTLELWYPSGSADVASEYRHIGGNLIIEANSTLNMAGLDRNTDEADDMGGAVSGIVVPLDVDGSITNNGTIVMSNKAGGDIKVGLDLTNTGTFTFNDRAMFFKRSGDTQNLTGISTIPFVLITDGAELVLNNDLTVNGTGSEFITFANAGSINLNSNILYSDGNGDIDLNDVSGAAVTGIGRVEVSSGNGTFGGVDTGNLTFGTNVTLAINGGTLTFPTTLSVVTLNGTLEVGDGATITNLPTYGASSTLHYDKSTTYNVGAEWPAGLSETNLPFNVQVSAGSSNDGEIKIIAHRKAKNNLTVDANASFTVEPGKYLTVAGNVANSGTFTLESPLNTNAAASLITEGTVTNSGTMIAERYILADHYYLISPPNIETSSTLFTTSYTGYFNPNLFKYDESYDGSPSSGTYSEWANMADSWQYAHDGAGGSGLTLSTAGKGYSYYNDESRKLDFDGTFNTGDKSITIYHTANDGYSGYFDGWNLIANPYPSAIDWDGSGWTKTNVEDAIYFWDGAAENYKYYAASGDYSDGTDVVSGGSRYIPTGQAFFVKAETGAGTGVSFTIPQAARVHNAQGFWKGESKQKNISQFVRLRADANGFSDELVIRFIPEGSETNDPGYDMYKMYSGNAETPQIYSFNETDDPGYALNSLPELIGNYSIAMGVEIQQRNVSTWTVTMSDFNTDDTHIYIEDTEFGVTQNLRQDSVYNFSIADSSDVRDRFIIHFIVNNPPQLSQPVADTEITYGENLSFAVPEETFTETDAGDELSYTADINGNPLPVWLVFNDEEIRFSGIPDETGIYTVTLHAYDLLGTEVSDEFNITVTQAELTATADDAFRDYGKENPPFTTTYTGFVLGDDENDLDELPVMTTEANPESPAGEYDILISGGSDNNYSYLYENGILTVYAILPEVNTIDVTEITVNSAFAEGEILSDGGTDITQAGFCYALSPNPDLNGDYTVETITGNVFSSVIAGLSDDTQYYLRSYAVNSEGTHYGDEIIFTTTALGININSENSLTVLPNPSEGIFRVIVPGATNAKLRITDITGKIISLSETVFVEDTLEINLTDQPNGEYNLEVLVNGKRYTAKLIKQ